MKLYFISPHIKSLSCWYVMCRQLLGLGTCYWYETWRVDVFNGNGYIDSDNGLQCYLVYFWEKSYTAIQLHVTTVNSSSTKSWIRSVFRSVWYNNRSTHSTFKAVHVIVKCRGLFNTIFMHQFVSGVQIVGSELCNRWPSSSYKVVVNAHTMCNVSSQNLEMVITLHMHVCDAKRYLSRM